MGRRTSWYIIPPYRACAICELTPVELSVALSGRRATRLAAPGLVFSLTCRRAFHPKVLVLPGDAIRLIRRETGHLTQIKNARLFAPKENMRLSQEALGNSTYSYFKGLVRPADLNYIAG